jgi:arsenate reductase (thioredoxin)
MALPIRFTKRDRAVSACVTVRTERKFSPGASARLTRLKAAAVTVPRKMTGASKMLDLGRRRPLNVLFLGRGNVARSIMAEAILNRDGLGHYRAFSAGRQPAGALHPCTLDLLAKMNFDTADLRCKTWLEFVGPDAMPIDFVFSVCDSAIEDTRLPWPGSPITGHWGLPDPTTVRGKEPEIRVAFADAFRMLSHRIGIFASLPLASLDELSLRRQIEQLSRRDTAAA